jgi:hypothetical protein
VAFTEDDLILPPGNAIRKKAKAKTMHLKTKPLNLRFKTLKNMRAGVGSKKVQSGGATEITVSYYNPVDLSLFDTPLKINIEDGNANLIEKIKNGFNISGLAIQNTINDFGGITYFNPLYQNHILLNPEDTLTTLGLPVDGTTPIEFRVRSKAYVFFYRIFYGDLFYMVNVYTIGKLISYLEKNKEYGDLIDVFSLSRGGSIKGGDPDGPSTSGTDASVTGENVTGENVTGASVENVNSPQETELDVEEELKKDGMDPNNFSGGGKEEGLASFKQILKGNVPTSKPAKPKSSEIWMEGFEVIVEGKVTNDKFKYGSVLPSFIKTITLENPLIPLP